MAATWRAGLSQGSTAIFEDFIAAFAILSTNRAKASNILPDFALAMLRISRILHPA
jgi:hypothetical protein